MAFTGKMVKRIAGVQSAAEVVHTNVYGAARNKGTFKITSAKSRMQMRTNERTIQGYGHSMTAQRRNKYEKSSNYEEQLAAKAARLEEQHRQEQKSTGYGRSGSAIGENRQGANASAERGGMGRRMFGEGSRFEEASAARSGQFNKEQKFTQIVGQSAPIRISSASTKPNIKPNFG